jgi:hypothetical protein
MTGRGNRLDREPSCLQFARDDGRVVTAHDLALTRDVVRMPVRAEHVGHGQTMFLHGCEQRLERCARVDEDGYAAGCVRDQVRVREPPGMHRALDDHGRNVSLGATVSARLAP